MPLNIKSNNRHRPKKPEPYCIELFVYILAQTFPRLNSAFPPPPRFDMTRMQRARINRVKAVYSLPVFVLGSLKVSSVSQWQPNKHLFLAIVLFVWPKHGRPLLDVQSGNVWMRNFWKKINHVWLISPLCNGGIVFSERSTFIWGHSIEEVLAWRVLVWEVLAWRVVMWKNKYQIECQILSKNSVDVHPSRPKWQYYFHFIFSHEIIKVMLSRMKLCNLSSNIWNYVSMLWVYLLYVAWKWRRQRSLRSKVTEVLVQAPVTPSWEAN